MTRITLVRFLLSRDDDDASSTVVVFYRDVMSMSMPRLHATTGEKWLKNIPHNKIFYTYARARTKREEEEEHHHQ